MHTTIHVRPPQQQQQHQPGRVTPLPVVHSDSESRGGGYNSAQNIHRLTSRVQSLYSQSHRTDASSAAVSLSPGSLQNGGAASQQQQQQKQHQRTAAASTAITNYSSNSSAANNNNGGRNNNGRRIFGRYGGTTTNNTTNRSATHGASSAAASASVSIDGYTNSTMRHIAEMNKRMAEEAEAERLARKKKQHAFCSIPLWLVFFIECIIVVAAFTAIVVFADVTSSSTASELIEDNVRGALSYAGTEAMNPFLTAGRQLREYRDRSLAFIATSYGKELCDDTFDALGPSTQFFSDTSLALQTNEAIETYFYARRVRRSAFSPSTSAAENYTTDDLDYAHIVKDIYMCSSSRRSIFKSFREATAVSPNDNVTIVDATRMPIETLSVPTIADFMNLDAMPRVARTDLDAYSGHEQSHVSLVLNTPRFTWTPHVQSIGRGSFQRLRLIMVGSAPFIYNVTFINNTFRTVYQLQIPEIIPGGVLRAGSNGVTHVDVISTVGFVFTFENLVGMLAQVTEKDNEAHTTLYALDYNLMIATSFVPQAEQFDRANKGLFRSGHTPFPELNEAYHLTDFSKIGDDQMVVNMGSGERGTIVGASVLHLPIAGLRFGLVQATPRAFYFGPVLRLRAVMVSLGVICAVLIMLICCWLAVVIYNGIHNLLENMALAAQMKNDRTAYITSVLSEIERLAKGFGKMNAKLLEARAYLPQHLLVSTSDDSGDEEEGSLADDRGSGALSHHRTETSARTLSQGAAGGGSRSRTSSNYKPNSSGNNNANNSGNNVLAMVAKDAKGRIKGGGGLGIGTTSGGLTVKRVTVLAINVRGYHGLVNPAAPSTVSTPTAALTELINDLAHANRGMIDAFHGDHFVLSFNAARANAEGPGKAARCALDIAHAGLESGKLFSMGISTGRACVGQLGTATLKRLSIIGSVYSRAICLQRICRRYNPPADAIVDEEDFPIQCLLDAPMAAEVQHTFVLQTLGGLYGAPFVAPRTRAEVRKEEPPIFGLENHASPYPKDPHTSAAVTSSAAADHPPPELFHCLRMPVVEQSGDEWLYEMHNNKSTLLAELNAIVSIYVHKCVGAQPAAVAVAAAALRDGIRSIRHSAKQAGKHQRAASKGMADSNTVYAGNAYGNSTTTTPVHPIGVDAILDSDTESFVIKTHRSDGEGEGGDGNHLNGRDAAHDDEASAHAIILASALRHASALADGLRPEEEHLALPISQLPSAIIAMH